MLLRARALIQSQRGLITHRQALEAGLTERDLRRRRLLRSGSWLRVRRGVYVDSQLWNGAEPYRERPLLRIRAARLTLRTRNYVFSHDSAGIVHRMGAPDPTTALVHVTHKKVYGDAVRAGVKHHLAPYSPDEVEMIDGLPVLSLARTALDLAREHGLVAGVAGCDFALRQGVARQELKKTRSRMSCWPYSTVMDEAIEMADPGAESWLESEGRVLVTGLGIGRPETQFGLTDGHRTVFCDLRVGRHLFELDGKLKYLDRNPSGKDPIDVLWEEKRRQDFVTGFKTGVSRITTHDCRGGRREAEVRLLREFEDTCARFGTDISDLAPYIVRRRRP